MQQGLVQFSWTFVFQIFNTIIIFLVLRRILFQPVTNFMDERTKSIENAINDAELKNQQADELKNDYESKLNNIKEERNQIIREATKRAEERSDEIIKAAQTEAKLIIERANLEIERERQKAINLLKDEISALSIMAATKVIEKELNEEAHQAMIKKFIEEVGDEQWLN